MTQYFVMMDHSETRELLLSIIDSIPFGIIVIQWDGVVILCNARALQHLGAGDAPQSVAGREIQRYIKGFPLLEEKINAALTKNGPPFRLSKAYYLDRYLDISGIRIPGGMSITTYNVTGEVRAEIAAVNAMLEGQEMERRRLSKEIHDGIGPLLSAMKLNLEALKVQAWRDEEQFRKNYHNAYDLLQTVTAEVRNISHALMPYALLDFGLVNALDNLCKKAEQSGRVTVHFYHSGLEERLEEQVELGLYRIAQELLNNALKYAQAKTISLQLIRYPDVLMLMVEDDGVGFDPKRLENYGIGLRNVQTRVRSLGGAFTLESQPGHGVLATIEIPNA